MTALFSAPKAPPPPPPPPAPPDLNSASIAEAGAAARQSIASAQGQGFAGTDVTGGKGAPNPTTTKTALGG